MEPEGTCATDTTKFEMRGITGRRDVLGVRTRRGRPQRRWCPVPDAFVRAFVVVADAEGVEPPLLRAQAARGGARGLAFQIAMHSFMGAVVLRTGRRNPLMDDAELHPPHVQLRQPVNAGRGKGRSVVAADRLGQPDRSEERAKHRLRAAVATERRPWQASTLRLK